MPFTQLWHGTVALHLANFHCSYDRQMEGITLSWVNQHSTVQHSTAQDSTAQHSTAPHSAKQRSTAQYGTAQHGTTQHGTAQFAAARSIAFQLDGMHASPLPRLGSLVYYLTSQ